MTLANQDNTIALFESHKNNKKTLAADISYLELDDPQRARLEDFIKTVFKKYYNADINHFYPHLLSVESENDNEDSLNSEKKIKAVAGVRCAADEMLFSEHYLSNELEDELQGLYQKKISRQSIVEVGNLAPANVGQMRWLIASITAFLYSAGFRYIVFTAVPGVYNAFMRMDVPLKVIIEAKRECLPEEIQHKWGNDYYNLKPMVLSGDIAEGFDIMQKNIYSSNKKLIPLFEKACQLGRDSMRLHYKEKSYKEKDALKHLNTIKESAA